MGAHSGLELDFQAGRANKDRTLLDVVDNHAFSPLERRATRPMPRRNFVPEIQPPSRKPALRHDPKVRSYRVEELNVTKVCAGNGDGHIDNLGQNRLQAGFAHGEHGESVQAGHGVKVCGKLVLGPLARGDFPLEFQAGGPQLSPTPGRQLRRGLSVPRWPTMRGAGPFLPQHLLHSSLGFAGGHISEPLIDKPIPLVTLGVLPIRPKLL